MSTKCIWCPTILPVFVCGAKHCYIGRQSQDSRQDQPISKQMSSTAHELHILFSTRHWRGKGIKIPILESSSCQLIKIFTMLWFLAERFSVKHGYPQPIATVKILISKTKKKNICKSKKGVEFHLMFLPRPKKTDLPVSPAADESWYRIWSASASCYIVEDHYLLGCLSICAENRARMSKVLFSNRFKIMYTFHILCCFKIL